MSVSISFKIKKETFFPCVEVFNTSSILLHEENRRILNTDLNFKICFDIIFIFPVIGY